MHEGRGCRASQPCLVSKSGSARTIPLGILQVSRGLLCLSELPGCYGASDHLISGNLLVRQVAIQSKQSESSRPGAILPLPKERNCCLLYFVMIEMIPRASFTPYHRMCWQNPRMGWCTRRTDSFLLHLKMLLPGYHKQISHALLRIHSHR